MHWNGEQMMSDGLDKGAAQEVREKGLLTRINRVLMPERYILFYTYEDKSVGEPEALLGLSIERYRPKEGEKSLVVVR